MQFDFLIGSFMQGQETSHIEIRNALTHKVIFQVPAAGDTAVLCDI